MFQISFSVDKDSSGFRPGFGPNEGDRRRKFKSVSVSQGRVSELLRVKISKDVVSIGALDGVGGQVATLQLSKVVQPQIARRGRARIRWVDYGGTQRITITLRVVIPLGDLSERLEAGEKKKITLPGKATFAGFLKSSRQPAAAEVSRVDQRVLRIVAKKKGKGSVRFRYTLAGQEFTGSLRLSVT